MAGFRSKKDGSHYPVPELRTAKPITKDMYSFVILLYSLISDMLSQAKNCG